MRSFQHVFPTFIRNPLGLSSLRSLSSLSSLLLILFSVPLSYANMRAPRVVPSSPSSALKATNTELIVTGEDLVFTCSTDACNVSATYYIKSARELQAELEFILPVQSDVSVRRGAQETPVSIVPAIPFKNDESITQKLFGNRLFGARPPQLFRANFTSTFLPGDNALVIEYLQPLGAEEQGQSYFKSGKMVQHFRYELWPLREWVRAPNFKIKVSVSITRAAPGLIERTFGNYRALICRSSAWQEPPLVAQLEQRGAHLWYETELGPSIPDHITCYIGEKDALPDN